MAMLEQMAILDLRVNRAAILYDIRTSEHELRIAVLERTNRACYQYELLALGRLQD
jgi:hypothetical protein